MNLVIIFIYAILVLYSNCQTIKPWTDFYKIYGPGWDMPTLALPSRYFFIEQLTEDSPQIHHITIDPLFGHHKCPIHFQQFLETRFRNNFIIIRYKLLSSICKGGLSIKLYDSHSHIVLSRNIEGNLAGEQCHCPTRQWLDNAECEKKDFQQILIDRHLSPFNKTGGINFEQVIESVEKEFAPHNRSYSLCHYQIIDQAIYRKCYGEYVGFSQFIDEFLISMSHKMNLPDVEFMMNLGDWPLSTKNKFSEPLPIVSWCRSSDSYDILLPTYDLTQSTLEMQGRVSLDVLSVFGSQKWDLDSKEVLGFWRGRDSHEMRLKLAELSLKHPHFLNASITQYFFFRDKMEQLGQSKHISFTDFFRYRYLISIDGTVAAYRFPYLMAGNSLILKQNSEYMEHFYYWLIPNVHYVPISLNLDDLIPTLKKIIESDFKKDAKSLTFQHEIINNARQFVLDHLMPVDIYCYHANFIKSFAQLLKYGVKLREGMTLVSTKAVNQSKSSDKSNNKQPDHNAHFCDCNLLSTTNVSIETHEGEMLSRIVKETENVKKEMLTVKDRKVEL